MSPTTQGTVALAALTPISYANTASVLPQTPETIHHECMNSNDPAKLRRQNPL